MNKKISWDQRLVNGLQILNQERIGIAHPDLSSEKMQQATDFLKEENILRGRMVDDVNKLKELWETSEELLQTSSTEGHDQGLSQDKKHIRAMPSFTSSKASGKRLLPHRFFQSKGTD
ncbi:uncharacterized protein LOC116286772 [Actinia tenebrosa]|uniref:Uncharacterized protein LOC116286772 n=1 Tax=Actinia tenebrosa TaxID=6105 RepID=A0A6P8H0K1_ACTTE|nr:uncharacterized protein LOC116286772 [Actinia tenebrosa]